MINATTKSFSLMTHIVFKHTKIPFRSLSLSTIQRVEVAEYQPSLKIHQRRKRRGKSLEEPIKWCLTNNVVFIFADTSEDIESSSNFTYLNREAGKNSRIHRK